MGVYEFCILAEVQKYGALHLENITGFGTPPPPPPPNNYIMVTHHMESKFLNKNCFHSFNHCIEYMYTVYRQSLHFFNSNYKESIQATLSPPYSSIEGFNDLRMLACMFRWCQVQEQNLIGVAQRNLNLVPKAWQPSALSLTYCSFSDSFTTMSPINGFNEIRRPVCKHV